MHWVLAGNAVACTILAVLATVSFGLSDSSLHSSRRDVGHHQVGNVHGSCSEERVLVGAVGNEASTVTLLCKPGTGALKIEAAYFGTPTIGQRPGRFVSQGFGKYGAEIFWEAVPNTASAVHPMPYWGQTPCSFCECSEAAEAANLCNCTNLVTDTYLDTLTIKSAAYDCDTKQDCSYFAAGACNAPLALPSAKALCDGQSACTIPVTVNALARGTDPCPEVVSGRRLAVYASGCEPTPPSALATSQLSHLDGNWGGSWETSCVDSAVGCTGTLQHNLCFSIAGTAGSATWTVTAGDVSQGGTTCKGSITGTASIAPITYSRSSSGGASEVQFFVNAFAWETALWKPANAGLTGKISVAAEASIGFTVGVVENQKWFTLSGAANTTILLSTSPERRVSKDTCGGVSETQWYTSLVFLIGLPAGLLAVAVLAWICWRLSKRKGWLETFPDEAPTENALVLAESAKKRTEFQLHRYEVLAEQGLSVTEGMEPTSFPLRHLPRGSTFLVRRRALLPEVTPKDDSEDEDAERGWALSTVEGWVVEAGTRRLSEGLRPLAGVKGQPSGGTSMVIPDSGRGEGGRSRYGTLGHLEIWGALEGSKQREFPVEIANVKGCIVAVACGRHHTVMLCYPPGLVYAWGRGREGQLGQADFEDRHQPTEVTALTGKRVVDIACGNSHSLALREAGRVFAWGIEGHGSTDEFGNTRSTQPHEVHGMSHIVQVAAGFHHSLCLDEDGEVWSWGRGQEGQLGHGDMLDLAHPRKVEQVERKSQMLGWLVVQVCGGGTHSLALTNNGDVYAWGNNQQGQLGVDSMQMTQPLPTRCIHHKDIQEIGQLGAGADYSACRNKLGSVMVWGSGESGKLGVGDRLERRAPCPVTGLVGKRVVDIACGDSHMLALTAAEEVLAWGHGGGGRLATGTRDAVLQPQAIDRLRRAGVAAVACGDMHSLVIAYPWAPRIKGKGVVPKQRIPLLSLVEPSVLSTRSKEKAAPPPPPVKEVEQKQSVLDPLKAAFERVKPSTLVRVASQDAAGTPGSPPATVAKPSRQRDFPLAEGYPAEAISPRREETRGNSPAKKNRAGGTAVATPRDPAHRKATSSSKKPSFVKGGSFLRSSSGKSKCAVVSPEL